MQAIKTHLSQNSKKERQKLFKSLVMGDRQATQHWENELDESDLARRPKAKILNSWMTLVENEFTYHNIHTYLITEFSKRN